MPPAPAWRLLTARCRHQEDKKKLTGTAPKAANLKAAHAPPKGKAKHVKAPPQV